MYFSYIYVSKEMINISKTWLSHQTIKFLLKHPLYIYYWLYYYIFDTYFPKWCSTTKAWGSLKLQPQLFQCFESRYWITPSSSIPTSYSWRVVTLLPCACILLSIVAINRAGRFNRWHTSAQVHENNAFREIFAPYPPPSRLTWTLILQ